MTERIITDSNGRKHITNEPKLHKPQRTWVGLTEDEISKLVYSCDYDEYEELVRATEAKLKEKNHG